MIRTVLIFFITIFPLLTNAQVKRNYPRDIERKVNKSTRFNYSNTALHFLHDSAFLGFYLRDTSESSRLWTQYVHAVFPSLREKFRRKVQFIPDTFDREYRKKLFNVHYSPEIGEGFSRSGCFLRRLRVGTNTVFYDINAEYTDTGWIVTGTVAHFYFYTFDKQPHLQYYGCYTREGVKAYLDPGYNGTGVTIQDLLQETFYFLLFTNTAQCGYARIKPGMLSKFKKQYFFNETFTELEVLAIRRLPKQREKRPVVENILEL